MKTITLESKMNTLRNYIMLSDEDELREYAVEKLNEQKEQIRNNSHYEIIEETETSITFKEI